MYPYGLLATFNVMNRLHLVLVAVLAAHGLFGQSRLRKMPANVNHSSINNSAPFIALDGNTIVYLADVAEDNALTLNQTNKSGTNWTDPVILPRAVNNHLNYLYGFGLSPDGNILYISNAKSNGMGGYDIYACSRRGSSWAEPVNLLNPINSKLNDACPSPSADGMAFYFMRCETMTGTQADRCKLMVARKKPNGQWDEPTELPAFINTGNSQSPRIMGDGETLIFASNKLQPNKGGMDLYLTRFQNNSWTPPLALDFANTPGDDQFVSASSLGRYLLKHVPGTRVTELVELLFPAELRPKTTIKIEGQVSGPDQPGSAFVSIFDLRNNTKVFATNPNSAGQFVAYVKEGSVYDLSIEPALDNYTFYSRHFDLTKEKFSLLEKVSAKLKAAAAGDTIQLEGIGYRDLTADLDPLSAQELRRVKRLMDGNPRLNFTFELTLEPYLNDTLKISPDMTEIQRDTIRVPVSYAVDSVTTATRDSLVVKVRYHNNRTTAQAQTLRDYFTKAGVNNDRLKFSQKLLSAPLGEADKPRTRVKLIIR
jgi:hypothetical protein